jgi:hypothetical protein
MSKVDNKYRGSAFSSPASPSFAQQGEKMEVHLQSLLAVIYTMQSRRGRWNSLTHIVRVWRHMDGKHKFTCRVLWVNTREDQPQVFCTICHPQELSLVLLVQYPPRLAPNQA